jgi:hypothetical protein
LNITEVNERVFWSDPITRSFRSDNYNFDLNIKTGYFKRWGETENDDPMYSPYGPEICDMEISTICHGPNGTPCPWCYKSNTPSGGNMNFETFKKVFHKLPKTVGQIAFGIGDINGNPDLWSIMKYCRKNDYNPNVIPNITINGSQLDNNSAEKFFKLCGSIAVSRYPHCFDVCYDAVEKLTDLGMTQVNIHQLLSENTLDDCLQLLKDIKSDKRLKKLNAVVFLLLKPKGDRNNLKPFKSVEKLTTLVELSNLLKINIGFDSCSTPWFLKSIEHYPKKIIDDVKESVEPCESFGFFSSYINYKGIYFPCSFCEGSHDDWMNGLDVLYCKDFIEDIWYSELLNKWRNIVIQRRNDNNLHCPIWDI